MIPRNWKWIAGTPIAAVAVHVASVLRLPRLIMMQTMAATTKTVADNAMFYPSRSTAKARGTVRPCPDLLYLLCVYRLDAAGEALQISTQDMPNTYWPVSVFDANIDNFCALNDRQTETGDADFVLTGKAASIAAGQLPTIAAPTDRGIVLLRTLVDDEHRLSEIDAARHNAKCAPYKAI